MKLTAWTCLLIFALLIGSLPSALAHTRSQSSSLWTGDGKRIEAVFQVEAVQATRLANLGWDALSPSQMLARHLPKTITVSQDGSPCLLENSQPLANPLSRLRHSLAFLCKDNISAAPVTISVQSFFALAANHQHIFFANLDTMPEVERILTNTNHQITLQAAEIAPTGLLPMVWFGMEHVASGLDHLLFLAALLLAAKGWRQLAALISSFTAGHMLTLIAVPFGVIHPDGRLIEVLIGLSIASVAIAALAKHDPLPKRAPFIVAAVFLCFAIALSINGNTIGFLALLSLAAFLYFDLTRLRHAKNRSITPIAGITFFFSLAHGAGFAGPLLDLNLSVPKLLISVVQFNIGVEISQLAFVMLALLLLKLVKPAFSRASLSTAYQASAIGLISIGSYWMFLRLM